MSHLRARGLRSADGGRQLPRVGVTATRLCWQMAIAINPAGFRQHKPFRRHFLSPHVHSLDNFNMLALYIVYLHSPHVHNSLSITSSSTKKNFQLTST